MSENLWPTDFGELPDRTPVSILREQAQALGARTANIVVARVGNDPAGADRFRYVFYLYSGALNYSTELLWIEHGIDLYPVEIEFADAADRKFIATNPDEFTAQLKELFARERTKRTIASLIAQSKE